MSRCRVIVDIDPALVIGAMRLDPRGAYVTALGALVLAAAEEMAPSSQAIQISEKLDLQIRKEKI